MEAVESKIRIFHHEFQLILAAQSNAESTAEQGIELEPQDWEKEMPKRLVQLHRSTRSKVLLDLYCPNEKSRNTLFKLYAGQYEAISAAGGRVWSVKDGTPHLLLILRKGFWDLPKGKTEVGESIEETALREVEEETGLRGAKTLQALPSSYHIYEEKGGWKLKTTYWYDMLAPYEQEFNPQTAEEVDGAGWHAWPLATDTKVPYRASLNELIFNVPLPSNLV